MALQLAVAAGPKLGRNSDRERPPPRPPTATCALYAQLDLAAPLLPMELEGTDLLAAGQQRSDNFTRSQGRRRQHHLHLSSGWRTMRLLLYILLWYCISISLTLYNKWLFSIYGFHFPLWTTAYHFFLKIPIARLFMWKYGVEPFPMTNNPRLWLQVAPVGITTALDIAFSNLSFLYITVTYYTITKSSVPLWILMFSVCFRLQKWRVELILILVTIAGGICLASIGGEGGHGGDADAHLLPNASLVPAALAPPPPPVGMCPGELSAATAAVTDENNDQGEARRALSALVAAATGALQLAARERALPAPAPDAAAGALLRAARRLQHVVHDDEYSNKLIGLALVLGASLCAGFRWACTQLILQPAVARVAASGAPAAAPASGHGGLKAAACGGAGAPADGGLASPPAGTRTPTESEVDPTESSSALGGRPQLAPAPRANMHPMSLVYAFSPFALLVLMPMAMLKETGLWQYFECVPSGGMPPLLGLLSIGGGLGFFLLIAELRVVQLSSGLTLSVGGIMKELLTVVFSAILLGDTLTAYNVCGLGLCLVGIFLYSWMKRREEEKAAEEAAERATIAEEVVASSPLSPSSPQMPRAALEPADPPSAANGHAAPAEPHSSSGRAGSETGSGSVRI